MTEVIEKYYVRVRRKKEQYVGFVQDGELLDFNPLSHARIIGDFRPEDDGLTFHLSAAFTDILRTCFSNKHARSKIKVYGITGKWQTAQSVERNFYIYK